MNKLTEIILKILKLDNIVKIFGKYIDVRIELLKSEVRQEIAHALVRAVMVFTILLISLLFVIFFSIGWINFINDSFGNEFSGYWFGSGFYAILILLIIILRSRISNYIFRIIFKNKKV